MSRFRKKFSGLRANAGQIILRSSAELRAVVVQCCLVLILFPLAGNSFVLLDLTSLQQDDESLARVSASLQENTYANSCKSLPLFVAVLENKINYVFSSSARAGPDHRIPLFMVFQSRWSSKPCSTLSPDLHITIKFAIRTSGLVPPTI